MLAEDRRPQEERAKERSQFDFSFLRWRGAIPEGAAISEKQLCSTKVCLLLRLGEASLAEAYWIQLNGLRTGYARTPKTQWSEGIGGGSLSCSGARVGMDGV